MVETVTLLLQRRHRRVFGSNHWRWISLPERVSGMYRSFSHHTTNWSLLYYNCPSLGNVHGCSTCWSRWNRKNWYVIYKLLNTIEGEKNFIKIYYSMFRTVYRILIIRNFFFKLNCIKKKIIGLFINESPCTRNQSLVELTTIDNYHYRKDSIPDLLNLTVKSLFSNTIIHNSITFR